MKGVFCVLLAIAASAMAYNEIFEHICSVSAVGTATISNHGSFTAKMMRVRDTARYDFYRQDDNALFGTILVRPDLYYTYLNFSFLPQVCESVYDFSLSSYNYDGKTAEGYDYYTYGGGYYMSDEPVAGFYLNGNTIVKESFMFTDNELEIMINYNSVDNDYVHDEVDDVFSLFNTNCSWAAEDAPRAQTWKDCYFPSLPDFMCSVSANGTGVVHFDEDSDVEVNVKMMRVRNTARYDFTDPKTQTLVVSVVVRSDTYDAFVFNALTSECKTTDYFRVPDEFDSITDDGLDLYDDYECYLYFNHTTKELVAEKLDLWGSISAEMKYSSVNQDYVHETVDGAFTLDYDSCPEEARTEVLSAKTSWSCSPPKVMKTVVPGCAYQFTAMVDPDSYFYYSFGEMYEGSVMMKDDIPQLVFIQMGNTSLLFRCDIRDQQGRCLSIIHLFDDYYGYESEYCIDDEYSNLDEYYMFFPFYDFEYRGDPIDVTCPDKSSGCKKYCNYGEETHGYEDSCRVYDKDGHVVSGDYFKSIVVKNIAPSVNEFKGVLCDGSNLDAPDNPCGDGSGSQGSHGSGSQGSGSHGSNSSAFILPSVLVVAVALVLSLF